MTALTDHITVVKSWIDDLNPSDALVESWVRIAEERCNNELRTLQQIVRDYATFDDNCAVYPPDWLENVYVKLKSGRPFLYVTPHAYWNLAAEPQRTLQVTDPTGVPPYPGPGGQMVYTTIGETLFVLPNINPELLTQIEIGYFRKIQPLGNTMDPVFVRFPSILLNCTLAAGAPYLIEDERLATFATLATAGIAKANDAAQNARWSGSPLTPVVKGFG
jgi:hypothetical protein